MVSRRGTIGKSVLIVQARVGSKRLSRKMLRDLCGKPVIQRVLERIKNSTLIDKFILAIPETKENDLLSDFADANGFSLFRGKEDDVLDRLYQAVINLCDNLHDEFIIIRVCADNPFIDPYEIDRLIEFFFKNDYDYAFNHIPALGNMYPNGLGAEILKFSVLKYIWKNTKNSASREHVTKYIWDNTKKFRIGTLRAPSCLIHPEVNLGLDTEEDFKRVEMIYKELIAKNGDAIFSGVEVMMEAKKLCLL